MKRVGAGFHGTDKRAYGITGMFFALLCAIVTVICFSYYNWLQATIREESNSYLQEISKKISVNVEKIVNDNFAMLSTVEMLLQNADISTVSQMYEIIEKQRITWNYRDLMFIDDTGTVYDETGTVITLASGAYLGDTVINRKNSITTPITVDEEECILFATPVEGIFIGETEIRALGAAYRLSTFDRILSTTAFDGQAYTHIINRDGSIAVPSSSGRRELFQNNVLTYLESIAPEKKRELMQVRLDIENGESGQFECRFDGKKNYVTYHPIEVPSWCLVTVVPVDVANAKTQSLMNITLLFCAFIMLLVTALVLVLTATFYLHKRKLERIAFVDPITGGHTLQRFQQLAGDTLRKKPGQYAIAYTNLEKFRIINEQFGREAGDDVLRVIDSVMRVNVAENECMCHIIDDHFCILLEYYNQERMESRFANCYSKISDALASGEMGLACPAGQIGVYLISDHSMPVTQMIDRAKFALNKPAKALTSRLRYALYDETAHRQLFREKILEDRMEKALESREFVVHLQPKYAVDTERVGGAEALVRWNSAEEGMIYPDEFIPLFEKNGFIVQLDLWVFETVCSTLRSWIDRGLEPVRVSINCSRVHFAKADFLEAYRTIFERYGIPARLIELELTESVVYENMERLADIIDQIHAIGFTCSIDDFGSGYSSLNMIQNVAADTLKLDRIFFSRANKGDGRTQSVVESIINMAKALSMETVAEGVEYRAQVDMLKQINCNYIQGYVFARPMPIEDFEKLTFEKQD